MQDDRSSPFSLKNIFQGKPMRHRIFIIDMAYYQIVDQDTFDSIYPYANGMTVKCANDIWSQRYQTTDIKNMVRPDEEKLFITRRLFETLKPGAFIAAKTFKDAFSDLFTRAAVEKRKHLSIYTVSMLPALSPAKPDDEPSPGNWISILKSDSCVDIIHNLMPRLQTKEKKTKNSGAFMAPVISLNDLKYKKFDEIYLVKDETLLPPHIDRCFLKLLGKAERTFDNVVYAGKDIDNERYHEKGA